MPKKKQIPSTENAEVTEQPIGELPAESAEATVQPMDESAATLADDLQETEKDVNIDEFAERMDLNIICRGDNETLHFSTSNISRPGLQLAGYYKHFAAERVQIMGQMEMTYL